MVSHISVLLFSLSTFQMAIGAFRALQTSSFEMGVAGLVSACVIWALGAVCGRSWPLAKLWTLRWIAFGVILAVTVAWPWVGHGIAGWILLALAALASGLVLPLHIKYSESEPELMRDAYSKMLLGGGIGGISAALIEALFGTGGIFLFAGAALVLAPFLDPKNFFNADGGRFPMVRFAVLPVAAVLLLSVGFAPSKWPTGADGEFQSSKADAESVGNELVLSYTGPAPASRKADLFVSGVDVTSHLKLIPQELLACILPSLFCVASYADVGRSGNRDGARDERYFYFACRRCDDFRKSS